MFIILYDEEVEKRTQQAHWETAKDLNILHYHHIKTLNRQNYVDMGIMQQKSDKLNKIAVIEKIIAQALEEGVDFICIDPLFAIVESGRELNRNHLVQLIKATSAKHITLLLLHHTTKQGVMALTQELRNTFDNIYRLDLIQRTGDYTDLKLTEEGARANIPHVLYITRTISEDTTVKYDVFRTDVVNPEDDKKEKVNMNSHITAIIENYGEEILPYQELVATLKDRTGAEKDEKNIKYLLRELRNNDNLIAMADGRTWKGGIKILRFSNDD